MRISDSGILNSGEPGTRRAVSTFPMVTVLSDDTLLASYRVGSTKDSDDETIELRRSDDGGRTWQDPVTPFETVLNGKHGSLKVAYVTPMGGQHLIVAAMWVDREAYPGQGLFNDQTEGCLPMTILLADSHDLGHTWTPWRVLPLPDEIGPPSLTSPLLRLPSGRLAISIETNKNYEDDSPWFQHVVYAYSDDNGQTWGPPVTVAQDPTARIFNWDQRAGVSPDGRVATFTWTYDRETTRYLNVHRRLSSDEGQTWTEPEDLGFTDQPSHPAILPDGRVVVAWVDRFESRSIRARFAPTIDAPFLPETEVVLYTTHLKHREIPHNVQQPTEAASGSPSGSSNRLAAVPPNELAATNPEATAGEGNTGDLLAEMGAWNFGLPYAETLPDGDVMVVYYEGTPTAMKLNWVRLSL